MFKTAVNNAKTEDIIHALGNAAPAAIAQAIQGNLPEVIGLTGGNIVQDGIKTGNWIRANVRYKIDDFENQNIQLPSAILRNGFGDCKSFSLLFLAIMNAAGYNAGFRFARYKNTGNFTHVYNIVVDNSGKIYTFDTCLKDLKELNHYKEIKDMRVNYIAGAPMMIQERSRLRAKNVIKKPTFRQLMTDDRYLSPGMGEPDGIGRKKGGGKRFFKKLGDTVKKGLKVVKTVGLAAARGPFLVLVDVNFRGLAKKLDRLRTKNPSRYQEFWTKLGGDIDALNKAVNKGKDKKPFLGEKKGVSGATAAVYIGGDNSIMAGDNGEYIGFDPATITAALASAAGIMASLQKLFKKEGIKPEPGEGGEIAEDIDPNTPVSPEVEPGTDFFANDPASETAAKYAESGGEKVPAIKKSTIQAMSDQVNTGFKLSPTILIGGAAAVLGIILLTKKKK